jgi:thiaminase
VEALQDHSETDYQDWLNFYFSPFLDAGGFQICSNLEKDTESEACNTAAVFIEAFENADEVLGEAVEEIKHEDNECNLYKGKLYRIL